MKIELAKTEVIHFVGIGGIGMSGLSLIMKGKGFKVQGSDLSLNKNIERLKKEKIKVYIGQKKQNLKNATIVVVSSAIKKNNPELVEAKRKNLPIIKRGKMLAHIVSLMKNIVVVGSHGKTTTTSLVASINSGLFFFIADETTIIVALFIFCFLWPIEILILPFFNLSIFLLLEISLPWTLKPLPFIIKDKPLMPMPPIPTKWIISDLANLIFIYYF